MNASHLGRQWKDGMSSAGKPSSVSASLLLSCALVGFVSSALPLSDRVMAREATSVVILEQRQWTRQTNGSYLRWTDAAAYCANLRLGGHADWRLPTLAELESLYSPDTDTGMPGAIEIGGCCLWSNTSLEERPAEDDDEIAGRARFYRWGFMFDGGHSYYAGPYYEDGEALCTRDG